MSTERPTEDDLQAEILSEYRGTRGHPIALTNTGFRCTGEADVLTVTEAGYVYEFEIKCSRSDFLRELPNSGSGSSKRHKHRTIQGVWDGEEARYDGGRRSRISCVNRLYFVTPPDLASHSEVPEYAGLIHVGPRIRTIDRGWKKEHRNTTQRKDAPLIHGEKILKRELLALARNLCTRLRMRTHE